MILLAGIVIALQSLISRLKHSPKEKHTELGDLPENQEVPARLMGLTKEGATARHVDFDLDAEISKDDRRLLRTAIRQSLISTYKIDLFGIAFILYLLGNPLGALGTLLIVVLYVILNFFQRMYAKKKSNQILRDLRSQAEVIRDGVLHSADPAMIGVCQGAMVEFLLLFRFADANTLTAYALIVFAVLLIIWLILGSWGLIRTQLKLRELISLTRDVVQGNEPAVR